MRCGILTVVGPRVRLAFIGVTVFFIDAFDGHALLDEAAGILVVGNVNVEIDVLYFGVPRVISVVVGSGYVKSVKSGIRL